MSEQASSPFYFQFISGNSRVHNGHTFCSSTGEHSPARLDQPVDDILFESLWFDQIHARRQNLQSPSPDTCSWILDTHEYKAWVNPYEISHHHGLLWIKGKPGVGKSILMNYLLGESAVKMPGFDIISFFFNARGHELERTVKGLYQALLSQIMKTFPDTKRVFAELGFTNPAPVKQNGWQEQSLKNLISYAIRILKGRKLVCYIDALDECPEEQARSMVTFFQEISRLAMKQGDRLNVCFSSRPYPNITIRKGLTLVIDGQDGHMIDIQRYIDSTLVVDSSQSGEDIKSRILEKSSGAFLWVALIIPMLNKAFDSGKSIALNKRLHELPTELSLLFHDMLMRDSENCDSMLLCIQLVLLANCPLSLQELYCGIRAGLNDPVPHSSLLEYYTMRRYILSSSKGLVEEVYVNSKSSMQFIHESVREFFLLDSHRLRSVVQQYWPHLSTNFIGKSQDAIKWACFNEITTRVPDVDPMDIYHWEVRVKVIEAYPFLHYAVSNVLFHSNEAQSYGIQQSDWIEQFPLPTWIRLHNIWSDVFKMHWHDVSILYVFACEDFIHLAKQSPYRLQHTSIRGGIYGTPLIAALACGCSQVARDLGFQVFLDQGLDIQINQQEEEFFSQLKIDQIYMDLPENRPSELSLFNCLAQMDCVVAMRALVLLGEDINQLDEKGQTPLMHASMWGSTNVVRWLWSHQNINKNIVDKLGQTALVHSCSSPFYKTYWRTRGRGRYIGICRIFLEDDSWLNFDLRDVEGRTALSHAISSHESEMVEMLLNKGADPNSRDDLGRTPLSYAAEFCMPNIVEKLLAQPEVDRDAKDNQGRTPLRWALKGPIYEIDALISMLLKTGEVDVNSKADDGLTPLIAAKLILDYNERMSRRTIDIEHIIAMMEKYNCKG